MGYIGTVNHKVIGSGYVVMSLCLGVLGGMMSIMIRYYISVCGIVMISIYNNSMYGCYMTLHGLLMVFMLVMGLLIGGMGNIMVVSVIGCSDVCFPRLNNMALLVWVYSAMNMYMVIVVEYGISVGWTLYPPLSVLEGYSIGMGCTYLLIGLLVNGVSSTLGSGNWIGTLLNLRMVGMSMIMISIMCACMFMIGILLLLVLGILACGIIMIIGDVHGSGIWYVCNGNNWNGVSSGGDGILWEHIFWLFGHPEVYIMLLPGLGVVSSVIASVCIMYGSGTLLVSVLCIGILGCVVWAHHMYVVGLEVEVLGYFGVVTLGIGIPTGCKLFNWCCSGYSVVMNVVSVELRELACGYTVMYVCSSFIVLIVYGGSTGILLGNSGIDVEMHDSYWVLVHFHVVLALGSGISVLLGVMLCNGVYNGI